MECEGQAGPELHVQLSGVDMDTPATGVGLGLGCKQDIGVKITASVRQVNVGGLECVHGRVRGCKEEG